MWYHPCFPPPPPDLKKLAARHKKKLPPWLKELHFAMGHDLGGPVLDTILHVEEGHADLEHHDQVRAILKDALLGKGPWNWVDTRLLTDSALRELEEDDEDDEDDVEDDEEDAP